MPSKQPTLPKQQKKAAEKPGGAKAAGIAGAHVLTLEDGSQVGAWAITQCMGNQSCIISGYDTLPMS
jgi:hypothetical protein